MLIEPDSIELCKPFQLFKPEDCIKIINEASKFPGKRSGVAGNYTGVGRTSTTHWWTPSFFDIQDLLPYFQPFYDTGYPVDVVAKPIQIAKYEPGQFFGWHYDQFTGKKKTGRLLGLTCTLQRAPGAYLESKEHKWDLGVGQAVIFPSNILHRATAPIDGERWAFTTWGHGKITKIAKRKGK